MRIVVVEPASSFSTADVADGLCAGLRAQGCEVLRYPLSDTLAVACTLHSLGLAHAPLVAAHFDPYKVASHMLTNWCYWKEPDAVIVVTGNCLPWQAVMTLKKMGFVTAMIATESPYITTAREQHDAAIYDHVFTNERKAVPLFTRNPPARVHYLAHAYNPERHTAGPVEADLVCDAFFVGTAFDERKALFAGVDWSGIDFRLWGALWGGTASAEEITDLVLDNEYAVPYYRSARINLNHHRTTGTYGDGSQIAPGDAESLGPRAYEIAACGGFQLCDDSRAELDDVFQGTIPTYRAGDSADLEHQIRYWLAHEDRRRELAAMQHDAVQLHSWVHRARELLSIILAERHGAFRSNHHAIEGVPV